jgi:hypothetical protein
MFARGLGILLMTLAVSGLSPSQVDAQRRQGRTGAGQDRAQLEQRIRARFGEMVQERLGLDEATATQLNDAILSFQDDRSRLLREERAVQARTEAAMLEEGDDDEEAMALLVRLQELRMEEAQLFQAEQQRLLEILSPSQLLRFHALREQMGRRIRQLRPGGGRPGESRSPGGGIPPGGDTGFSVRPWFPIL